MDEEDEETPSEVDIGVDVDVEGSSLIP